MKTKNYSTWKVMPNQCRKCRHYWLFESWDDSKEYLDLISGKASKLCKRCITAKSSGEYRFPCEGCAAQVRGTFEDVRGQETPSRRSVASEAHQPSLAAVSGHCGGLWA